MKRTSALAAVVLLTGCETLTAPLTTTYITPAGLQQVGTKTEHSLRMPQEQAALCIARNAENYISEIHTTVRPATQPDAIEVQIRLNQIVALAIVRGAGPGSAATLWLSPVPMANREAWVPAIIKGC